MLNYKLFAAQRLPNFPEDVSKVYLNNLRLGTEKEGNLNGFNLNWYYFIDAY